MDIQIIQQPIRKSELSAMAEQQFGDFVKAVVDVEKGIVAVGGKLHADEEAMLLQQGSQQHDVWGVNLYPAQTGDQWLEFDSMINVRPSQGNRSRVVEDPAVQQKRFAPSSMFW